MGLVRGFERCRACNGVATCYYFSNDSALMECWRCGSKTHITPVLDDNGELIQTGEHSYKVELEIEQGYGVSYLCYCGEGVFDEPTPIFEPITEEMIEEFKEHVKERGADLNTSFLAKWENGNQEILVGEIPGGGWIGHIINDYAVEYPPRLKKEYDDGLPF